MTLTGMAAFANFSGGQPASRERLLLTNAIMKPISGKRKAQTIAPVAKDLPGFLTPTRNLAPHFGHDLALGAIRFPQYGQVPICKIP